MKSNKNGSLLEGLARHCAKHPWRVVTIWVMLLAIALTLFLTIFSKNMTTVTEFTSDTDSKKSETLFKEEFPQAAYKQENCVVTSDTYTADDPEFWAYVDGLWASLGPLRDSGVVKDVQYFDPALREGVPLVPPLLEQMVAAIRLVTEGSPTSEQLLQASADLKASGAELRAAANALPADLTGNGETGRDGMLTAAAGADELACTLLLADGLQKTYDALLPVTTGEVLTPEVREAKVAELKAMAARLSAAAAYLEANGPGTADRPTLVSGLKQFGEQGPMLAAMYEAKYAAQLGRDFAVMLTSDNLPTAAAVTAVVDDMTATAARLNTTIAYVEQNVPDSTTRQTLLDGLNSAASQMKTYGTTVLPILSRALAYVEDPESGIWGNAAETILKTGLNLASGYMKSQIAAAEAGLKQMQDQTSTQIGTVADGLSTLHGQLSTQLPTAVDGLQQAKDGMVQARGLVSTDKHTTLFVICMSEEADEAAAHILELRDVVLTGDGIGLGEDSFVDGFRVRMVGGTNVSRDMQDVAFSDLTKSLAVAIPIALVVLLLVFGTLGAATLPIVLSLVSIMVALGIAAVVGTWIPLNFAIENIVFMLGLALGIDHALFFAYRYREERRKGRDKVDAIAKSGATASHAIFYAGIIVAIALFGILMIPCNMHRSLAMGAIIVVAVLTPATITLLPAVLSLIGNGFDFGRLPWQKRITDPLPPQTDGKRGFWWWVSQPAMKAPVISFLLATMVVAACIWPKFQMNLGYSYVDTLPPSCVSRSGYDAMMDAGYPNMLVAPLEIAIDGYDKPAVRAETETLIAELEASGDFVTAVPLAVNDTGDVAWKRVFLNMDPFTAEASDTVRVLRNDYIGDNFKDAGGAAYVSGYGAFNNDFVDTTANYTTPVLAFVMGLSLLLLLVAFRSVLLAVVLSVFNLLSVYAAYGMVVFVFQGGHSMGLYTQISGIDAYVPIFLLCGLLGISMDYFVFMVARVRERYDQTENLSDAILFAFRRSGLVVLGAAAVMLVVFMAFSVSQIVIVAELGFGMFAAILLDATVITLVLSPATMKLLGRWFWWWPSWLNWVPDLRAHPGSDEVAPEENVFNRPTEFPEYAAGAETSPQPHWRS